jgi:hypothetical protein
MHKGSGDDDTGAELLRCHEDETALRHTREPRHDDWRKDSQTAGHEDDEKQSHPEGLVVFTFYTLAGGLC